MANNFPIAATATGPVGLVKTFANVPAGACVVVVVFAPFAGMTVVQGFSPDVVDSKTSKYSCVQQGNDLASTIGIYTATNLAQGPLTVTCTVGSAVNIFALAFLPKVSPYYVCAGSSEENSPVSISNQNTAFRGLGGTPFTTLNEAMVIWGRTISAGVGPPTTAPPTVTTGTVLYSADLSAQAGVSFGAAAGVDDVASIPVSYTNEISFPIFGDAGSGICVFLNNNNASCQFSVIGLVPPSGGPPVTNPPGSPGGPSGPGPITPTKCPPSYSMNFTKGQRMIERHFDYILVIPSLAPGASVVEAPLPISTDAPFVVRGRGIHIVPPAATRSQADVNLCRFRFKDASGNYLAQIPIQTPQDFWGAFGQGGNYRPVYPQVAYPPGGTILVDFYNDSPDTLTNTQIIFRGVKLYKEGSIIAPTYPPNQNKRPIDFTYQTGKGKQQGSPNDPIISMATTSQIWQQSLQIKDDADFVLRGLQAGLWTSSGDNGLYSPFGYTELYVQLFDSNLNPHSNVPIHIDWLFGNGGGTQLPGFTALGNAAPGIVFPELYLKKNTNLYFNLTRLDAPYVAVTDALPVRLSMAWIGSKVYA